VQFRLRYEFASRILEKVVGPVFDHIAASFVDAFVRRAAEVYGPR
jgi:ribosome-associated toxin RatA of RatAB toxin-antitoxin module